MPGHRAREINGSEKLSKTLQNFTEFLQKLYEKGKNPENFTINFPKLYAGGDSFLSGFFSP
jgi:hypothetical protein